MGKVFKTKFEYCHIQNDRILISKTSEIQDLIGDYAKSMKDFFKTLMVFFISIPLFTGLSLVLYYNDNTGLAIYAGAFALLFLTTAFYSMLFTSGSPVILKDKIINVIFKKVIFFNIIEIKYREFGLAKRRSLVFTNDQVEIDHALSILLEEGLIKKENIKLNGRKIEIYSQVMTFIIITSALIAVMLEIVIVPVHEKVLMSYGVALIIGSTWLIFFIVKKIIASFINR